MVHFGPNILIHINIDTSCLLIKIDYLCAAFRTRRGVVSYREIGSILCLNYEMRVINGIRTSQSKKNKEMESFAESGLNADILKAIGELGFDKPTPIQAKTLPVLLETHQDMIALAQTGTGKTAAFGLPIIQLADTNSKKVQALILSPTRELAVQIANDIEKYSKYMRALKVVCVYGGANIQPQREQLKRGCQVVVGTPGRVLDLIRRGDLKIQDIKWTVFDEADEMLNMGFKDDLDAILAGTPDTKQTLLFSATMPKEIVRIADNYMSDPIEIAVGTRNAGAENVEHKYYVVQASDRYNALKRVADINPDIYGIVFCRTRRETKEVADKLIGDGYNADALHGDLSQQQRDYVMQKFRSGHLQILVATDVAARGLDVNSLTHVINYNLPDDLEAYIHRSGRTGRAGKSGISISILHSRETGKVRDLERMSKKTFQREMVPTGNDICEKQLISLIDKIEKIEVNEDQINPFLPSVYEKLEHLSREELIAHFVSAEFNRFLDYYKNAPDLNVKVNERAAGKRRDRQTGGSRNMSRLFINLGTKDDINPPKLIGLINERTNSGDIEIGDISIMKKFSFLDVDAAHEAKIIQSFKDFTYKGFNVFVEASNTRDRGAGSGSSSGSRDRGGNSRERGSNYGGDRSRRSGGGSGARSQRSGGYSGGGKRRSR